MIKFKLEDLQAAMEDGTIGFCVACGNEQSGVEPDAQGYVCENCDRPKVYGAEELIIMGLVK
jgi:hypothetical protein